MNLKFLNKIWTIGCNKQQKHNQDAIIVILIVSFWIFIKFITKINQQLSYLNNNLSQQYMYLIVHRNID